MKKVAVIMGSASDLPVVEKAIETLDSYGIPYEVHVYSAHRTPVEAKEFSENDKTVLTDNKSDKFDFSDLFYDGKTQI